MAHPQMATLTYIKINQWVFQNCEQIQVDLQKMSKLHKLTNRNGKYCFP